MNGVGKKSPSGLARKLSLPSFLTYNGSFVSQDMEVLSQEIVRLSKECVGSPDPDLEPGETS